VLGELELFDAIVAENGALLYGPKEDRRVGLAPPPPAAFVSALHARGVVPLEVGDVIVATRTPYEAAVIETIRQLGLDLQVIFNKGAVMVLPAGVTKASGLAAWLERAGIAGHSVVGVGDAENDLALMAACEASAAVANALPSVKAECDIVLAGDHGAGVRELIEHLLADDLRGLRAIETRRAIPLAAAGEETFALPAFAGGVLLAGRSGGGKTTAVTAVIERLAAASYQCLIVDPEGDYDGLDGFVTLGDIDRAPRLEEIVNLVRTGGQVVVNLLDIALDERPAFASSLLAALGELRATTGRPHWIIVDEAHHLMPAQNPNVAIPLAHWECVLLVTIDSGLVAPASFAGVDHVIAVGEDPRATLTAALNAIEPTAAAPRFTGEVDGDGLLWRKTEPDRARCVTLPRPQRSLRRHRRKYAAGELADEAAFTFTGADQRLRLRANNLQTFLRMAEGVDDATWEFHRSRGDYSRWFRTAIKDEGLGDAAGAIERDAKLDAAASRKRIASLVSETYTAGLGGRSGSYVARDSS
jgi:hypothetical protein